MLARVFQFLAENEKRPDIDAGVFAYAKAGFGDYVGFLSAFGYWIGSVLGNDFYRVLITATLGRFFPYIFGDGASVIATKRNERDDAELGRAAHVILDYPIYICIVVMF
jgi:arginine:ornithine antiporter/lysine permease